MKNLHHSAALCMLVISSCFIGCVNVHGEQIVNPRLYQLPTACDFARLVNNALVRNDCSPRLLGEAGHSFAGLLINAPSEILWPKNFSEPDVFVSRQGNSSSPYKFMVSGLVQLPKNTLSLAGDFSGAVMLEARGRRACPFAMQLYGTCRKI